MKPLSVFIIYGYFRQSFKTNSTAIIPQMIIHICLLFYFNPEQYYAHYFDEIDPDDNGDADEKEFIIALKRCKINLTESDMSKLFKLIDEDKSGYINRQDWKTFCMTFYDSKESQRLQDAVHNLVLSSIKQHSRKPSALMEFPVVAWTQAFLQQGTIFILIYIIHQNLCEMYIDDIQQRQNDPTFAEPECTLEWTPREITWWLDCIDLVQYAMIVIKRC